MINRLIMSLNSIIDLLDLNPAYCNNRFIVEYIFILIKYIPEWSNKLTFNELYVLIDDLNNILLFVEQNNFNKDLWLFKHAWVFRNLSIKHKFRIIKSSTQFLNECYGK